MPAPTTNDEFLEVARKSGVVDEKRLNAHVEKLRAAGQFPAEPIKLATILLRDGLLTQFQAEQFLQGKWKRFTLGKYKVLEKLGSGGMGTVYLCEHILMRRRVAVKVLPPQKADESSCLDRFQREARAVAALDHPNIVRAYDIDREDNLHFLVMEHVDGSSLQEIIKRTGGMDVIRAAHYIRQAALGLQHAHETAGLVHRDIKPGNILVDRNGIVKVLDMGLARFFHDEDDQLTKKHDESVLGTADYLAPEQALDSHVDIRADIYSLGGTFYYCLSGKTPFADGTVAQKLIWHQTRQPKPLRGMRPDIPEGICAVIDRMMAKDRNQRFQTPMAVADALAPWTQTPIPPPPESEMPHFSLAAVPRAPGEAGMSSASKPTSDVPPSPPPRKSWQVASSGAPSPAPTPATAKVNHAPAARVPVPKPAAQPRPVPAPVPAPAPQSPAPSTATTVNNGTKRNHSVPALEMPTGRAPSPSRAQVQALELPEPEPVSEPVEAMEEPQEEDLPAFEQGGMSAAAIRRGKRPSPPPTKISPLIFVLVGVVALGMLGIVSTILYFVFGGKPRTPEVPKVESRKVYVSPAGLSATLRGVNSNDRVILAGDIVESFVWVTQSNITIEGEEGKTVTWRCPTDAKPETKLLLFQAASNVTIKNITFDGGKRTQALILFFARCPNVRLVNCRLINTAQNGVLVSNSEGSEDEKIVFDNVKIETEAGQSGVRFQIVPSTKAILKNRYLDLRKCEITGPGKRFTTDAATSIDETIQLPAGETIEVVPGPKSP